MSIIAANKYVECTYDLYVGDDEKNRELEEQATEEKPLEYIHGMGMMLEEFEKQLFGKSEGDNFEFTLSPDKAYGERNKEALVELSKDIFTNDKGEFDDTIVFEGNVVPMVDSEGNKLQGIVVEVSDNKVKMDFNHPMAGETLHFIGKIITVRDATEKDLNNFFGEHIHGGGCGSDGGGCGSCGCGC